MNDGASGDARERAEPLFSVITPAYNMDGLIGDAIDSVLAQTLQDWELLIVDDGSTDSTLAVAQEYERSDPRIRVFRQPNTGTGSARNKALSVARAPWILLLDADDMLAPECIRVYEEFIRAHPGHAVYTSDGETLYPSGHRSTVYRGKTAQQVRSVSLRDQLYGNQISGLAAVIDADALRAAGGFSPDAYHEDYELWLRMLMAGGTHIQTPARLAIYRILPDSKSRDRTRNAASRLAILKGLDRERIAELGLERDLDKTLALRSGDLAMGEIKTLVIEGKYREARQLLYRERLWAFSTPGNLLRALAVMVAPPLYRAWLTRSP